MTSDEEIKEAVVQAYAGEHFRAELSAVTGAPRSRVRLVLVVMAAVAAVIVAVVASGAFWRGGAVPAVPSTGPNAIRTIGPSPFVPGGYLLPVAERDRTCTSLATERLSVTPGVLPEDRSLPQILFRDDEGTDWIQLYVGDRVIVPCVQLVNEGVTAITAYAMPNPTPGARWLPQPMDFLNQSYEDTASWVIGRAPAGVELVRVSIAGEASTPAQLHDGYFFVFWPHSPSVDQFASKTTITAYTSDRIYTKTGPDGKVTSTPR